MIFKRLIQYVILFFLLIFIGVLGFWGISKLTDNSLDSALKRYETNHNANELRRILLSYRGEADNHSDCIEFLAWGRKNQKDFIEIIEGISSTEKPKLVQGLAFAAIDSGQANEFQIAFKDFDSYTLNLIRSEIQNRQKI